MTGATAECFGCGQRFARDQLEDVGDTVFCRACHARMLRRIDERRTRGIERVANHQERADRADRADRAASARPAAADAPCFVCGGSLDGPTLFELRGFAICGSCARGLIGDEPPEEPEPDVIDASDASDDALDDASGDELEIPRAVAPEGSSRVVVTPGGGTEWCTGCGRAMPGPGSYQLIAGRPYCPACVAARRRKTAPLRATSATNLDEDPPSADRCDACSRAIDPAAPETQGFRLCAACLHSDPELALAIARSRHQRRLERAGRRLLEGDDD